MSQLSFICFCVEHYADHVHRPSNEIYQLFKREGLLDLLRSDYEDLHGMGLDGRRSPEQVLSVCHRRKFR